jgi:hypothetical protein
MKVNDMQIAVLTSCAALLPLGAILAPVYGITHHLKKESPDIDAKFEGYNFQSIGQITLVTFIWIASASHNYYLLLGLLAGVAASNIANTGFLPVEEYNAVKNTLDSALESVQDIDLESIPQNAKLQFMKLKTQFQSTLKKIKGLNSKDSDLQEPELDQTGVLKVTTQDKTPEILQEDEIEVEVQLKPNVEETEPTDSIEAVELSK